jgi:hypothetical protein
MDTSSARIQYRNTGQEGNWECCCRPLAMNSIWDTSAYSSSWFIAERAIVWDYFEGAALVCWYCQLFSHKLDPVSLVQTRQWSLLQASPILFLGRFKVIQVLCWLDNPTLRPWEWISQYSYILPFTSLWRTL